MAVRPPTAAVLDDRRTDWVRQYRHGHARADLWATGLRHVSHSMETQERVFRMAEQLEHRGVDPTDLFVALEDADRSVAPSGKPHDAAEAGHRAISTLVPLAEESVVICADAEASNPDASGVVPLAFDGHDPAAYAWAMFELSMRADAERRARWRRCESQPSMPTAIGVARL